MGLGVAEAPAFPSNSRVLGTWFPQAERATATGVYSVGQYFGLAFLSPLLFWIAAAFGWRALLIIVGAAGILFGFVWYAFYRDPHESRANQAELDYIAAGGGVGKCVGRAIRVAPHLRFCYASGRSSARRSGSSRAIRRWCFFSPGFRPTSPPNARWDGSRSGSSPFCRSSPPASAC